MKRRSSVYIFNLTFLMIFFLFLSNSSSAGSLRSLKTEEEDGCDFADKTPVVCQTHKFFMSEASSGPSRRGRGH